MIRYTTGDILRTETDAVVNTVNCVGVMGRGIALQFKRAYPDNFKAYAAACRRGEVQPGHMFVFETGQLTRPRWVINFPTKRHWRGKSRIQDIKAGLVALVEEVRERGIRSIAIPPLGSGLGGLNWPDVRALIEQTFESVVDVDVLVFEPGGGPVDSRAYRSRDIPKMTPGRAALVGLMERYLRGLMDPEISLLEVHKLMYFMQEAGEPLRLKFGGGAYGPYAENLRHVLKAVDGHLVSGFADGAEDPKKVLELVPGAVHDANEFLKDKPKTRARFEKVVELVDGFETPFGLELLATVYWLLRDDTTMDDAALTEAMYGWNERKRQFTPEQIQLTRQRLEQLGWLTNASPG